MTRTASTDRARHATAYLEAASIATEYIRNGVKIDCAIQDHGVSAGAVGSSWGAFIGALASRILARGIWKMAGDARERLSRADYSARHVETGPCDSARN